jgi:kynureninase
LIGAAPGTVVLGDTLSIKVYQALASALEMNPRRKVILSDTGNFPSDLYMAEGLCRTLGGQYRLKTVAPEEAMAAIDDNGGCRDADRGGLSDRAAARHG